MVWHKRLAIRVFFGKPYNPALTLDQEMVTFIGDSTFHIFGAPISIHNTSVQARDALLKKVESLLHCRRWMLVSSQDSRS